MCVLGRYSDEAYTIVLCSSWQRLVIKSNTSTYVYLFGHCANKYKSFATLLVTMIPAPMLGDWMYVISFKRRISLHTAKQVALKYIKP